jgi:mono/diheme cytochrome c family protein
MRKVFKWLGIVILLFAILVFGLVGYVKFFLPDVGPAPELKVEITPERVERGHYLANSVAVCMDCHSKRDWTRYSGPLTGDLGSGGEKFDQSLGFPGAFYSKNITPYALKSWTDGEIFRAVTTGVNKDGKAMMPVMPYHYYGQVDKEDIYSIIAYLRTLPAVESTVPESIPDFPFSVILNTIPRKGEAQTRPQPADTIAYGGYLVKMAACVECHTKVDDKAQLIAGTEFGGGREFMLPWGTVRTPNITSHTTGIGAWSRGQFVSRFKMYTDTAYHSPVLTMNDFNTIMPWTMYGNMSEADLSAIYQYLRTLKPIENTVEKYTPKGSVVTVK